MRYQKKNMGILVTVIIMLLGLCIMPVAIADNEVVFQQDFSKDANLEGAGWKSFTGQATEFMLKDECLEMLFSNAPYKGGNIHRIIPAIASGTFTFDVAINTNNAIYDHFSLKINLYNLNLAFKQALGSGHKLMRLYDGKWKDIADNIPVGKKIKVKIVFDNSTKVVQYFVDDMDNPVMIDENVTLVPADPSAPLLMIGNYGLAAGKLEHKMFNIALSK